MTREFKLAAVKLVKERGVSAAQAARDLGINKNVISRWVLESGADNGNAFLGRGQMKPELAKAKAERDILKKPFCIQPIDATLEWSLSAGEQYLEVFLGR